MSTRTYDLCFRMINAGEITPDEALAEAHALAKFGDLWQESIDLLIGWAWHKQDEIAHMFRAAQAAEVRTIALLQSDARFRAYQARWAVATSGEEPF